MAGLPSDWLITCVLVVLACTMLFERCLGELRVVLLLSPAVIEMPFLAGWMERVRRRNSKI